MLLLWRLLLCLGAKQMSGATTDTPFAVANNQLFVLRGVTLGNITTRLDNNAVAHRGSVVLNSASMQAYNCTFSECHGGDGGAVFVSSGYLAMSNVVMRSNSAISGGALSATDSTVLAHACRFVDNVAEKGGAVLCSATRATFEECSWESNQATKTSGGAVLSQYSDLQMSSITGTQNSALQYGGFLSAQFNAHVQVHDAQLTVRQHGGVSVYNGVLVALQLMRGGCVVLVLV